MLYALRKLIAFVFLGGIVTYIYCDLGHLWDPTFGTSVFVLVLLFAAIWLVVPPVVVYCRAWARRKRNRRGYEAWRTERGDAVLVPYRPSGVQFDMSRDEEIYFCEKATLYADSPAGFGERLTPGRVGDVAFPALGGKWFKQQRVRIWITNQRVRFTGKDLDLSVALGDLDSYKVHAGGIVFVVKGEKRRRFAFVLKNPLITAKILGKAGERGEGL